MGLAQLVLGVAYIRISLIYSFTPSAARYKRAHNVPLIGSIIENRNFYNNFLNHLSKAKAFIHKTRILRSLKTRSLKFPPNIVETLKSYSAT